MPRTAGAAIGAAMGAAGAAPRAPRAATPGDLGKRALHEGLGFRVQGLGVVQGMLPWGFLGSSEWV